MASKKGTVNNAEFLTQLTMNSKSATQSVTKAIGRAGQDGTGEEDGRKRIEYIDIFQMDAAPGDWNRYPLLKESQKDKYLELKLSIYEKGVEDPLVLWQRPGGRYMVLAGHNRREACVDILNECAEEKGFNEEKYRKAPCIVYMEDELDDDGAKEIIDDTNLYRDFSKLPEEVRIQILNDRAKLYKKRRYAKGERIDQLAKDFGLKKTAIYEAFAINEQLVEPLRELYFSGKLKKKSVLRFVCFDKDKQEWICEKYQGKIDDAIASRLKKNMTMAEISEIFDEEPKAVKKVTVEIPEERLEEFRKLVEDFLARE